MKLILSGDDSFVFTCVLVIKDKSFSSSKFAFKNFLGSHVAFQMFFISF